MTAPAVARKPMKGTVRALSDEGITLAVEGRDQRIPRGAIVRIEASQGRNRRKGLLIGGIATAAAGAVVGGIGCRDSADFDSSFCAAILGGFGFAAGAGVGAIVGAGEHWKDLPAGRVHVSVSPTA